MGEVELPDEIEAELKKEAARRGLTPDELAGNAVDDLAQDTEPPEDELDPPLEGEEGEAGEEGEPPPAE